MRRTARPSPACGGKCGRLRPHLLFPEDVDDFVEIPPDDAAGNIAEHRQCERDWLRESGSLRRPRIPRAAPGSAASDTVRSDSESTRSVSRRTRPNCSCEATHASNSRALNGFTRYSSAPALQTFDARLLARAGREQNHRQRPNPFVGANRGDQAKPVEGRHHDVGEHQIGNPAANVFERGSPSPTTSTRSAHRECGADSPACRRCRRRP